MFRKFENLIRPFENVPDGTPPAKLWPYMVQQLAPFKKWLPWMALTGVLVALMESGLIFYSGRIIDLMGASSPDAFWGQHGFELILVIIFILFLRPVIITLNHFFLEQTLASNLQDQTRWRAHKHMLGQSSSFFQNDFAGRLSNRVMQLGPAVEDSTYMAFEGIWYATTYVLGAILILSQIDIRLGAPLAIWLVLYMLYVRRIAVRVSVASEKWSAARSLVTGRVVDAYSNIETVKLFAHGASEEAYALSALRRLRLRFQRFLRLMTEMSFGLNLLNGALMVGVVGPAIWLWINGHVTIGEVAAASALTIRLNGMSGWIMWVTIRLFEHAGVIREGLESIAKPQAVVDAPRAPEMVVDHGAIHISGLSHHYGKDQGGLNGIDLHIPAGQRVGLIGRSGAGKSSLVNLLLRFRDAEQGEITIDGQNVSDVTQDSLRRQIGMVTQDSSLLHRSVRANLLYGRPDASEDEMIAAAQKAEAHEFILDLEDPKGRTGYNAHVGERGVKLSGGQRQRVAIARVILKDAPILILDEATSALDSQVEAAIQDTLFDIMENKTVIAIAHRLSTIAQMDRIVVLDEGAVVEDGSHDELLASGGIYAELWARQSGGFLGVDE
ncbi:multidrug ABC transporter ATP-binding protein [Amylibacter ulvae]|uniref:Multidrug ABC transporter ATP-binding protein n=1 Tax=Paramylibacter ulvae TaxID=1651968 RepID=A0ABQ3D8S9_9RHOB|nr:ABC transporter ATP-binding protein [Amylibacter ulvae]GHA61403.1 multidrug ABC transporter ATP-binding protein [Amylibacter ulvae]